MKKITILALHLGYGGIEKCISNLANALCDEYEINIISTYHLYEEPGFYLDKKIRIEYLLHALKPNHKEFKRAVGSKNVRKIIVEAIHSIKVLYLRRRKMILAIKNCQSDIVISTRDIHNLWLGKYGRNDQMKIGWEHNHHNEDIDYIDKIVQSAQNLDYFISVSSSLNEFYTKKMMSSKCKCIFIPNAIDFFPTELSMLESRNLISVGRLSKEKGYDDLIDVFSLVQTSHPNWRLDIVGDGLERGLLMEKTKRLHLENKIDFHGFKSREYINTLLANASINLMTSYSESFGIVILEASAFGVPSVAFSSAQGAIELIVDDVDGKLVDSRSIEEMARVVCLLITDIDKRKSLGAEARKNVEKYDIVHIKKKWCELFENSEDERIS